MAFTTFAPPVAPSPGTGRKRKIKILEADFGDGYSQPTPDGLNHMRKTVSLAWDTLTEAQMLAIDGFLEARRGTDPFWYKPAGETAPRKWTCKEWESALEDGAWKLSATLEQSFASET